MVARHIPIERSHGFALPKWRASPRTWFILEGVALTLLGVLAFVTVWNELLEESSGGVGATPATCTEVASVGDFGIGHLLLEGGKEWHGPSEFTDVVAGFMDACSEVVVVGPKTGGLVAKGDNTSTC